MRIRSLLLAGLLIWSAAPSHAATLEGTITDADAFAFSMSRSEPNGYRDVVLFAVVSTRISDGELVTQREVFGGSTRCDFVAGGCEYIDLSGTRSLEELSFEPLMNAVTLDYCVEDHCVDARFSRPSLLSASCVAAGCTSVNPWIDGSNAHLDLTSWQTMSRGSYSQGSGTMAGMTVSDFSASGWTYVELRAAAQV